MATGWETLVVPFTGGLINNIGVLEQGTQLPGSAIVLDNFEPSIEGGYAKIKGYTKFDDNAIGGSGTIIGTFPESGTAALVYKGDTLYRSLGSGWTSVGSFTGSGTTLEVDYFNFDGTDKIIIVDGVNGPITYDLSTNTASEDTSAPSDVQGADKVAVFKDHIFFGKGPLLSFTGLSDETKFDAGEGAGVINVGSDIEGMVVFREQLIVFSIDRIQRLVGNTLLDFVLEPITERTGCIDGRSIQIVGGDVVYLGPDGVRRLGATDRFGDFALARVSENIQRNILDMISTTNTFPSIIVRGKNQYRIFSFSSGASAAGSIGYLATQFEDQTASGFQWGRISGIKVKQCFSKRFGDSEIILFVDGDNDYVYQMEGGEDFDGENIVCRYQSPYIPINDPRFRKTAYKHTIYINSSSTFTITGNLVFDYGQQGVIQPPAFNIDYESGTSIYGAAVYGTGVYGGVSNTVVSNNVKGSGFVVSLTYNETSQAGVFSLNTAILEYRTHDRK